MNTRATSARIVVSVISLFTGLAAQAAPDALEIGPRNIAELPGGREADGIIGDFVLRNDRIETVIAGNQHDRRPDMFTHWHIATPGCLYDMTIRDADNDQIVWFAPGFQHGLLSNVSILKDGSDGEAIIRAELSIEAGNGFGKQHDYILRDGWQYVLAVSTYTNDTDKPIPMDSNPGWKGLADAFTLDGIAAGPCQDAVDRVGYAYGSIDWPGAERSKGKMELAPHTTFTCTNVLAIGNGSLGAYGVIAGIDNKPKRFTGSVVDANGQPASNATIRYTKNEKTLVAYVGMDGSFEFTFPADTLEVVVNDIGRGDKTATLKPEATNDIKVDAASGIRMAVTDDKGEPLPCKVQFIGQGDTKTPNLGPIIRAHGCDNQYQSENGHFTQQLPSGKYKLVITRGIEYNHVEKTVDVPVGKIVTVEASLKRVVDTTGWVSCDFHNHTTVSGDNFCGVDDRVINLAAEHIEYAPSTEHNRIYDWQPHIETLGLTQYIKSETGIELTGSGPHLNAFPLEMLPHTQDNGGPRWNADPRISALTLRQMPGDKKNRWVQLNHPTPAQFFAHLHEHEDGDMHSHDDNPHPKGFPHLESLIDGAELWGVDILAMSPAYERMWEGKPYRRASWPFAWMQMMNTGTFIPVVAASDAHQVTQGGVGAWRMYVPSSTDSPADIDPKEIIANAKASRHFISSGPFLEVSTDDGAQFGDTIVTDQPVKLHIRVQCNTWTDISRVTVLVNGRISPMLDFSRARTKYMFSNDVVRFDREITVHLDEDAYLIVVAAGTNRRLETGYGQSWQNELFPVAYGNPIMVDVDGNGFQPNGDLLDQPLLQDIKNK